MLLSYLICDYKISTAIASLQKRSDRINKIRKEDLTGHLPEVDANSEKPTSQEVVEYFFIRQSQEDV